MAILPPVEYRMYVPSLVTTIEESCALLQTPEHAPGLGYDARLGSDAADTVDAATSAAVERSVKRPTIVPAREMNERQRVTSVGL